MGRVLADDEILLGGVPFKIVGQVTRSMVTVWPGGKVVIGPGSKDDQPILSTLIQKSLTGGMGIYRMQSEAENERAWKIKGTFQHRGMFTLPPYTTNLGAPSGVTDNVTTMAVFNDALYVTFGQVVKILNSSDVWADPTTAKTLDNVPSDAIVFNNRLFYAHGTTYTYWNGSTWTTATTKAAKFWTLYDNKLVRVDVDGNMAWSTTGDDAGWTAKAKVPLPSGYVTSLFVHRDASGDPAIVVGTKTGYWVYDEAGDTWNETELTWPFHPNGGKGACKWRGDAYLPYGMDVFKYVQGNPATVQVVGPANDDGVPAELNGEILKLQPTQSDIYAIVSVDETGGTIPVWDRRSASFRFDNATIFNGFQTTWMSAGTARTSLLAYNGYGWGILWQSTESATKGDVMLVASHGAKYRLYWSSGKNVHAHDLDRGVRNPRVLTTKQFDPSGEWISYWFMGNWEALPKLGVILEVHTSDCSADEIVLVRYGVDFSETWRQFVDANGNALGTITANGLTQFYLGATADGNQGEKFDAIRFKFELSRGSDKTKRPIIDYWSFGYAKLFKAYWGWRAMLDLDRDTAGYTSAMLVDKIIEFADPAQTPLLIPFTYRDADDNTHTYMVRIARATGQEETGHTWGGKWMVELVSP